MTIDEVLEHFGSSVKTAHALSITRQAIHTWRRLGGIPLQRQDQIEKLTKGRLSAKVEDTASYKRLEELRKK